MAEWDNDYWYSLIACSLIFLLIGMCVSKREYESKLQSNAWQVPMAIAGSCGKNAQQVAGKTTTRKIVTEVKKPDGVVSTTTTDEKVQESAVIIRTPKTKYSLGLGYLHNLSDPMKLSRDLQVEGSVRILDSDWHITSSYLTTNHLTLGVRVER